MAIGGAFDLGCAVGKTSPELEALLERARHYEMTPTEKRAQRRSFILGEAGMGSDADEAAYRTALEAGDDDALARLEDESAERVAQASKWLDAMGL